MIHEFSRKLSFSLGEKEAFDISLLKSAIPGCVDVYKTDVETDKRGVDYVAVLRGGAEVNIDAKTREPNASRFWNGEPELALEIWSVIPNDRMNGKTGWTLSESTPVDMILYTFDKKDCDRFYLLPFQHLRTAFIRNLHVWQNQYGWKIQRSNGWTSQAMFVPVSVVLNAVTETMAGIVRGDNIEQSA